MYNNLLYNDGAHLLEYHFPDLLTYEFPHAIDSRYDRRKSMFKHLLIILFEKM